MEQQWEHKIKDAYKARDKKASFHKKDELWNRISYLGTRRKGVAAFWRIAAIFLALIACGGVLATVSSVNKKEKELIAIQSENSELQRRIELLQNREPEKVTQVQIVEKEKVIYKEVLVREEESTRQEPKIKELESEIYNLKMALSESGLKIAAVRDSLNFAQTGNDKRSTGSENFIVTETGFRLKAERVKEQIQTTSIEPTPKMKLQILKMQGDNLKYDSNTTFLKK